MADQRPLASEPTPITGAGLDGTIKKLSGGMGYSSSNRIRRGNWGVGDADCRRRRANPFLEEFWVLHSDIAGERDEPADGAQQRRLAAPRGVQQHDEFVACALRRDVVEHSIRAVENADIPYLERRGRV